MRTTKPSSLSAPATAPRPATVQPRYRSRTAADLRALQPRVDALAASLHAQPSSRSPKLSIARRRPLRSTARPDDTATLGKVKTVTHGRQHGFKITDDIPLYVATPALLSYYGIRPSDINANTDIITGRSDLAGFVVIAPRTVRLRVIPLSPSAA